MSNYELLGKESKGAAMDAALAANRVWDRLKEHEDQLGRLFELMDMQLEGVTIQPEAMEEAEQRVEADRQELKVLIRMAMLVAKHVDPYPVTAEKQLPPNHDFITLVEAGDNKVPVITGDNFKNVYLFLNENGGDSRGLASELYYELTVTKRSSLKKSTSGLSGRKNIPR